LGISELGKMESGFPITILDLLTLGPFDKTQDSGFLAEIEKN
jgi:hypothetical protein